MNRRDFIALLGCVVAWPLGAYGQQGSGIRRIAVLGLGLRLSPPSPLLSIFFQEHLQKLGWSDGRNVHVEVRSGANMEQMSRSAAELLAGSPDVIFAYSNLAVDAIKPAGGLIPIVFAVGDPVGSGYVASLARPGGTMTGFETFVPSMGGKWLEVLKEIAPNVTRALALMVPETSVHQAFWKSIQESASRVGVEVVAGGVHNAAGIEAAVTSFAARPNGGLITLPHAVIGANSELIVALEVRHRLPAVHQANDGSLASYSIDFGEVVQNAAGYVDRILRGANPADLPVQAPTKFSLVINLKVAKAIDLEVPSAMLLLADEVIE
jgi:putative ABC transport system substrate-binding protein